MKKISLEEVKRNLKRVLKNKISINEKTVITYLMTGMLGITNISQATIIEGTASGTNAIAIGSGSESTRENSIVIGTNSKTDGTALRAIVIGTGATASNPNSIIMGTEAKGTSNSGIAIGNKTEVDGADAISIGTLSKASGKYAGTFGVTAKSNGENAYAIGVRANASGADSFSVGTDSKSEGTNTIAIGKGANATQTDTFAIGTSAQATGQYTMALGKGSVASSKNATAIGYDAKAAAEAAIAFGRDANAGGTNSLAIGISSKASHEATMAFGRDANAVGINSLAIGVASKTSIQDSIAIGRDAEMLGTAGVGTDTENTNTYGGGIAIGKNAKALGRGAMAVGTSARAQAHNFAMAVGDTARAFSSDSLAVGVASQAGSETKTEQVEVNGKQTKILIGNNPEGVRASAFGREAKAIKTESTALGALTKADVNGGVALGATSIAHRESGSIGFNILEDGVNTGTEKDNLEWKSTIGAVSVGANTTYVENNRNVTKKISRQITNVAAGSEDGDAVNVAQLKKAKVEVVQGDGIVVTPDNTVTTHKKYTISLDPTLKDKINSISNSTGTGDLATNVTNMNNTLGNTAMPTTPIAGSGKTTAPTTVTEAVSDLATAVNNGLNFKGNTGDAINKKLGDILEIIGTLDTNTTATSKNIRTGIKEENGTKKLEILLSERPDFKKVTVGADNTKITIGEDGKISGLTDGTVDQTSTEAVTGKQLYDVKKNLGLIQDDGTAIATDIPKVKLADGTENTPAVNVLGGVKDAINAVNRGLYYGADQDNGQNVTHYLGSRMSVKSTTTELTKNGVDSKFVGKNLVTEYKMVEETENGVRKQNAVISIGLSEKPEFKEVSLKDDATYPGKTTTLNPEGTTIKEVANGVTKETKTTATGTNVVEKDAQGTPTKTATYGSDGTTLTGKDAQGNPITASYKTDGSTIKSGDKETKTTADGVTAKDGDSESKVTADAISAKDGDTTSTLTGDGLTVKGNDANAPSTTYGKDGMSIKGVDGTTEIGRNDTGDLTITKKGADGSEKTDTLATGGDLKALEDKLGLNNTKPTTAATGPAGKDGLDGKSFGDKIDALRDGTAGNTVYVGPNGERLEKGLDGKYYPEGTLKDLVYKDGKDGKPAGYYPATNGVVADDAQPTDLASKVVAPENMSIAQVNPDGTVKNPVGVSNVASGIGLNGYNGTAEPDGKIVPAKYDATKAADVAKAQEDAKKLYELDGNKLNNAVTAGDLQALAVAGLDFTGNNDDVNVHRELGTKLTVEGERNDTKKTYTEAESAKNNIIVEADKDNNKLVVKMASDLADINSLTTREKEVDGKKVKTVIGSEGTTVTKADPATPNAPVEKAVYGLTTEMTKTEADGAVKATTVSPKGMTVKADNRADRTDKSEATYNEDGLTVKDNKGNEAISLTSTTADDKTTNTLALKGKDGKDAVSITSGENGEAPAITFAKSGTGADEKGTGTITGLKDVEKNPDGTAKDRTQAANAGYVDDRLAEMNAGKPFEYFDTNGNQVVRGKDGKFYTPKELEGKVYKDGTDGTPAGYYPVAADGTVAPGTQPITSGKGASEVSIKAMPNDAGPVGMSGVASGIGLNGYNGTAGANGKIVPAKYDATKAADVTNAQDTAKKLYELDGDKLNNVVTAGDLQALAVAGLDFVGNETTKTPVHRPLGTKLVVEGESTKTDKTLTDFGATAKDNIYVDTDATNNKLVVKMTEDLKNINTLTTKPIDNGDGTSTITKLTGKGTEVSKEIPGTVGADGTVTPAKKVASTNYGADGLSTKEFDPATGAVKGETTVSPTGVNLYGKDGKDGKDAKPVASLVNNVVDGKDSPTLEFAKEGTGADAKGTGSITGLKAPEVDKKTGKALDPTAVASAGYVDNKIDNLMTQVGSEYKKDENGNVIFDADGKPVIKQPKFKPLNGIKTNEDGSTEVVGDVTEPEKEEKTVATAVEEIITKMNEGVRYVADQNENAVKNSDGTSTSEAVLNDDKIGVKDENYKKQYLGSSLAILSGEGVEIVKKANGTRAVADGTVYKGDNLITEYTYESGNGTVRIAMKENPEFKTLAVNDEIVIGNNDGTNPVTINKDTGITVSGDNGSTNITGNTLSFEGVDAVDVNGDPITDANGNTVKTPTGRITGLAAPELNSDGTLKDPTQAISAGYVSEKMGAMDAKLNTTKKDLSGGIAGAVAMANLPQVRDIAPHKHNIAAAYGYYGKEQALALGVSGISDNERAIYKASASINTRGDVAFGLGLGYQFDAREDLYGENIIDRLNKLNAENIGIRRENEDIKRENSNIRRENAEFKSIIQQLLMDVNELKKSK